MTSKRGVVQVRQLPDESTDAQLAGRTTEEEELEVDVDESVWLDKVQTPF
jgi:hypothetical protein